LKYGEFKRQIHDSISNEVNIYNNQGKCMVDGIIVEITNFDKPYILVVYITIENGKEKYKALILTNRNVSKIEVVSEM